MHVVYVLFVLLIYLSQLSYSTLRRLWNLKEQTQRGKAELILVCPERIRVMSKVANFISPFRLAGQRSIYTVYKFVSHQYR